LIVVTADTDFPMHLALRRATSPSIVLLRGVTELSPDEHARLLVANLSTVSDDLRRGAIVSLGPDHLRVRRLPLR
jgi:predicted nuclease of predicted toxin-antitoxin system